MKMCPYCGSTRTRMMGNISVSFPSSMNHNLTRANMRSAQFRIHGVLWETMDLICEDCNRVEDAYGNYVTRLEKENAELRARLDTTAALCNT